MIEKPFVAELDRLAISRKTLSHRRLFGRLTEDQSDRVLRIVRMVREARDVFGDNHKADTWLRRPTRPLGGIAPLELLSTDAGTKRVEALLGRIDHGIAA